MSLKDAKCDKCRTLGEKLFLKGDRCVGPKCAMVKRSYPAGMHGQSKRGKKRSGYCKQLIEKQGAKRMYGLRERQFANYIKEAARKTGDTSKSLVSYLESRLDNAVFRTGLAVSRPASRQLVSHGHIEVNGKKVDIPSYRVMVGDVIAIREQKKKKALYVKVVEKLSKAEPPAWLSVEPAKASAKVLNVPMLENPPFNAKSIIEFYSR